VSKISELSDGGSLVSSDYLIAVRSGGNVKVRMDQINVDQVDLGDNEFIRLGNSQDLTMVHTSTQSIINQAGTGDLLIQKAGATKASITANGLEFPDNSKAIFGAGSDLQIYHDGTDSFISDQGTGNLKLLANDFRLANAANNELMLKADQSSAVTAYYAGAEKLATTATGIDVTGTVTADKVTIGTSSASNGKLTLEGVDGADSAGIYFNNTTATNGKSYSLSSGNSGEFMLYDRTSSAYRLFVSSSGNVGIGTASPVAPLHTTGTLKVSTGNAQGILALGEGLSSTVNVGLWRGAENNPTSDGNYLNLGGYNGISFATGAAAIGSQTTRFRIALDGSISTPTAGTSNVRFGVNAGNSIASGGNYNVVIGDEAGTAISTASSNTAVGYQAGYSNETGGGNTFIGNAAGLAVTTGGNNLLVGNSAGVALTTGLSNTFVGAYSNSGSGACGGAMTTGSKNTIIGGYSGNQGGLDIRTTSNNIVLSDGDGNPRLWSNNLGRIFVPEVYTGTTAAAANVVVAASGQLERSTSSIKYKRDVQNATHGLAEVLQLRPVTYKGKGENDGETVFGGLIAEEVHEAGLTEFVQYAADGSPDALAYGNMVSLLTKAIQEQQAIIDSLTARIEALES
jgi:hypothetical protein